MSKKMTPLELAQLIASSKKIVVLTGPNLSGAAGVPEFRGPGGLYELKRYCRDDVYDLEQFRKDPVPFFKFAHDYAGYMVEASPIAGHDLLVELEKRGQLSALFTENPDLLHQRAGSSNVVELQGSYSKSVCIGCGVKNDNLPISWWRESTDPDGTGPQCPQCGNALRPGVAFEGEVIEDFSHLKELVADCDLFLALGSSLHLKPTRMLAESLPLGSHMVIVTLWETTFHFFPALRRGRSNLFFINKRVEKVLSEVSRELEKLAPPATTPD